MNKQAYFKMMKLARLNKAAYDANIWGPAAGAFLGLASGNVFANTAHKNPSFLTRLFYILPLLALGIYGGNKLQNHFNKTDRNAFFDEDTLGNVKKWWSGLTKQMAPTAQTSTATPSTPAAAANKPEEGLTSTVNVQSDKMKKEK